MQLSLVVLVGALLVSVLAGVSPSFGRDPQIDAGELKAVNFQILLNGSLAAMAGPGASVNGNLHFNKTNFSSTPNVIVGLISYGMSPMGPFTALNAGFRFNITSKNKTNCSYTITTFGVSVVALHYHYFAVLGYDSLYYMGFDLLKPDSTDAVANGSIGGVRTREFTLGNPMGMVAGANFTGSEMVLQVWPYYFLFVPTGSALSFNLTARPTSTTAYAVTLSANEGCAVSEVGIAVLYLNKTKVYEYSYTQLVDISSQVITGSNLAGSVLTTTMGNATAQYQFRNSAEGIEGVYLPFNSPTNVTVWYFASTSSSISKLYYKSIQEKLIICPTLTPLYLVDDRQCYSSCPSPRYATNSTFKYCKACHYSCLQCSSADTRTACTACTPGSLRGLANASCLCQPTFYDNGTELCAPCQYTCLTCLNDTAGGCLTCDSALHRVIANSSCPCAKGYYENSTCFSCFNFCTECMLAAPNQTYLCLACNASLFMEVHATEQTCVCQPGYYNNSNTCSRCIDHCLACLDGTTCVTCDAAGHWEGNSSDGTCKCMSRFFVALVNSSTVCSACEASCLSCLTLSSTCTSCDSAANRLQVNNSCPCVDGFYDNATCIACLNACTRCSFSVPLQVYSCLACNSSLFQVVDASGSACECSVGYYDNAGSCAKCMAGCTACLSGGSCLSCNGTENWVKDSNNVCVCDSLFFLGVVNASSVCLACDSTCLSCSGSSSSCLSCDSALHRTLVNSSCPCSTGFYANSSCLACVNNCLECSFASSNQTYSCLRCDSGLFHAVDAGSTGCMCAGGYFNVSGVCTPCITGCQLCASTTTCLTCSSAQHWVRNVSDDTCVCASSFYRANSTTCLPCQTGCLSCLLNPTLQCMQCDSTAHFQLSNDTCACAGGYQLVSSQCLLNSSSSPCGNGVREASEECEDGNRDDFDGCSSSCTVQPNHFCLNNLTALSVCYYNGRVSFSSEKVFKVPLENRVVVSMTVSAPNCNSTYLQKYLEESVSIELHSTQRLLLASPDISSQSVQYDPATGLAELDFQYNQDIDLNQKQVKFVASLDFAQTANRYFYASPSTVLGLSSPDNLLLTTYSSPEQLSAVKAVSLAFAVMIGLMWFFWLVSLCYHQTASAVEFMLVAQVAYEALLQRRFITDGWIGLVLYGKYCYGYNVEYSTPLIFDRLSVLSLNSYLFHTINIATAILFVSVVGILAIFCYETARVADERGDFNVTEAKIQTHEKTNQEISDEESQYKIKKGVILVLFEVATSFALLTVKIVAVSLMLASVATAIDVTIVGLIVAVCYFAVFYFTYKFYDSDFLNDFSFKRLLKDPESTAKSRSFSAKVSNFFTKYYYLCIFILLLAFGIVDGLPSFGAPFYIAVSVASAAFLLALIVFGVYFRVAHAVRAGFNLLALTAVMVLHLLESLKVDHPSQTLTGPIICLFTLYAALTVNFGLMAYIELRRFRSKKPKYSTKTRVAPINLVQDFNYTEDPHIPQQGIREPVPDAVREALQEQEEVRRSDKSGESMVHESKFQSLKSKSNGNSFSETNKKMAIPYQDRNEATKQKPFLSDMEEFVIIRQPVRDPSNQPSYEDRSEAERIEIVDMGRSVSGDFAKTKPKFKRAEEERSEASEQYGSSKK